MQILQGRQKPRTQEVGYFKVQSLINERINFEYRIFRREFWFRKCALPDSSFFVMSKMKTKLRVADTILSVYERYENYIKQRLCSLSNRPIQFEFVFRKSCIS